MRIYITKPIFNACRDALMAAPYSMRPDQFDDKSSKSIIDLSDLLPEHLARLRVIFGECEVSGVAKLVREIRQWERATTIGAELPRCKVTAHAPSLIRARLAQFPEHHVFRYRKEDVDGSPVVLAYYVANITYTSEDTYHNKPEYVEITLAYRYLGNVQRRAERLYAGDVLGKTADEMLMSCGLYLETPELRSQYTAAVEEYDRLKDRVGLKLLGRGIADAGNLDSAKKKTSYWEENYVQWRLAKNGVPSPLVIDVRYETDKVPRETDDYVSLTYWSDRVHLVNGSLGLVVDSDTNVAIQPTIPVHPYLIVFDLLKDRRVCVHVSNVEVYKYNKGIRKKLVLDPQDTDFIDILLHSKAGFSDIVDGKGGGTIVLLQGLPGTGKTLTAEVFAEEAERVLYSVQCSQLGTKPDDIEQALIVVLERAKRWNGIVLLDESDVFVLRRGRDIAQNAIVGVFLRVLEYHAGVLFMTTNRGDVIDDAVASRCVARISYGMPPADRQARIWKVLLAQNGVEISDLEIQEIVAQHPMTGRDIKQSIKLGLAVMDMKGVSFNAELVKYTSRFKPDSHLSGDEREARMAKMNHSGV